MGMELIAQLEAKFEQLISKIKELEAENARLTRELAQASGGREEIRTRIERLLGRIKDQLD